MSNSILKNSKVLIWDFDGVIKQSNKVKTDAFADLFSDSSKINLKKIIKHHKENQGLSRYDKIPLYYKIAYNKNITIVTKKKMLDRFSKIVVKNVIGSKWSKGVKTYLSQNKYNQIFYIATATPTKEIIYILNKLKIKFFFHGVYGSPMSKEEILKKIKNFKHLKYKDIAFIGDSYNDFVSAKKNNIKFIYKQNNYIIPNIIKPHQIIKKFN